LRVTLAPWWAHNSKEAYSAGLANLATALSNWSSSRSGRRAGRRVAFPRFKGRRGRLSCRFTTGAFGLGTDRRHIQLPRIGRVRTHESTRKLARKVEAGTARIRSATLSWQRGRWHVAFSVELPDPTPPARTGGRVVGVDLGITSLAVLSTGQVVPNPRHLDGALRALRRTQRQASGRRGPDPAHPHGPVEPVAQDEGPGGRVAHPRGQCPPRRAAQAPPKTGMAGNGYRRGKAQIMSQGRHREGATP
jgi:putative transposase